MRGCGGVKDARAVVLCGSNAGMRQRKTNQTTPAVAGLRNVYPKPAIFHFHLRPWGNEVILFYWGLR